MKWDSVHLFKFLEERQNSTGLIMSYQLQKRGVVHLLEFVATGTAEVVSGRKILQRAAKMEKRPTLKKLLGSGSRIKSDRGFILTKLAAETSWPHKDVLQKFLILVETLLGTKFSWQF